MKKNFVDFIMTVSGETADGCGEDSGFAAFKEPFGIISVFDGCGGIGSKKYASLDNRTGAYIASKSARDATEEWFSAAAAGGGFSEKALREGLISKLQGVETDEEDTMKGSLAKRLPTTVSVAAFCEEKKGLSASFIWAGDSRGYIFEPSGLVQITRDDIVGGGDALFNLRNDARLSNFASAEGDFTLNCRRARIGSTAMLITATDGCFGYFKTPMEFEYVILKTMLESDSLKNWKNSLTGHLSSISGDDFTMHICGCGGFEQLQKAFKKRKKKLESDYISKLDRADHAKIEKLWNKYKQEYYG